MANNDALVMALFAAFATFTAFGAAVAGFVAAGGAVQTLTSWWTQHGEDEVREKTPSPRGLARVLKIRQWSARAAIIVVALIIIVVILISGAGIVLCFMWLDAYSHGAASGVPGIYTPIIVLFWIEALLLTAATAFAVSAAAGSALTSSGSADKAAAKARAEADMARALAESSADLDAALRKAALGCLDGAARVGST
jgi:hypothetical protein